MFCVLAARPAMRRRRVGSLLFRTVVAPATAACRDRIVIAIWFSLTDSLRFLKMRGFRMVEPFASPEPGLFVRTLEE